ncbi:MAG: N-acetyltransferase [Clostridiaceae bacterium]|nr:N-acetyltransferase [Clostridiaceae bacterium]
MQISKIQLREYLAFMKKVYKDDKNFKDNKTGVINIVCKKNRPFFKASLQEIVAVKEKGEILCACVLILNSKLSKKLCVSFFEALPECNKAVSILMNYAEGFGRKNGCCKIIVALDGHVNYSVGFGGNTGTPSFGESYSPAYYHKYFESFSKVKFVSFYDAANLVRERIDKDIKKFEKQIENTSIEYADFGKGFFKTMKRYTDLNNKIFQDHKYYYFRDYDEDADLFKDMRPLLENHNLIFAKLNGEDIGFILWYPDYNELVPVGKAASIMTFIKYKLLGKRLKTAKVVEIAVLPKCRQFGVVLSLFDAAIKVAPKNTKRIMSSWILDKNIESKAITCRYTKQHYKEYFTYEKEI